MNKLNLEDVLVLDIETVPLMANYEELSPTWQALWAKKAKILDKDEGKSAANWYERAGIYAEFGKVICIGVGIFYEEKGQQKVKVKSFENDDEKALLESFIKFLKTHYNGNDHLLCAHNGKEFDFPYLCRRILVHGLELPKILEIGNKKPWEIKHIDTLELWKFGDYKNFTSLNLLAALFNIPTPKDDIDGSMVRSVYWEDKDLKRIATYCKKDVATTARLLARLQLNISIADENVVIV